jgi:hypothetical protein
VVYEKVGHKPKKWLDGDDRIYYVLVNGTSGIGVDIFMSLPSQDAGENGTTEMLVYVDQRSPNCHSYMPRQHFAPESEVQQHTFLAKKLTVPPFNIVSIDAGKGTTAVAPEYMLMILIGLHGRMLWRLLVVIQVFFCSVSTY